MIDNLNKPKIVWNSNKKIFIKKNVLTNEICNELIEYGNQKVIKGINKYPHIFNVSFDTCLLPLNHKVHNILQDTWSEVIDFFKFNIGFVEPYELKRYSSNDFFEKHVDNYYSITEEIDRKITMSIMLSDINDYSGGEFTVTNLQFKEPKGSVICIPSFIPHSVNKITDGVRFSLIGWAWGPYWK